MKKFVEKLIERLEEKNFTHMAKVQVDDIVFPPAYTYESCEVVTLDDVKAITIELSEEYSANTPQKSAGDWIPVTERLPEYDEESEYYEAVIVTLDSGRVTNAYYRNLDDEWWVNAGGVSRYEKTEHVIAWQSFPKAYGLQKSADWKKNLMNGFLNVE